MINTIFKDFQSPIQSFDNKASCENDTFLQASKIEFESDTEDDLLFKNTLSKNHETKKGNSLLHPLAGHFNRAMLQNHIEGKHPPSSKHKYRS
jgi:hypothetical protein